MKKLYKLTHIWRSYSKNKSLLVGQLCWDMVLY